MTAKQAVELVENGEAIEIPLDVDTGIAVAAIGFVDARPVAGTSLWSLRPLSKVGAIAAGDLAIRVVPKIPIARVVFLLQHSRAGVKWRDETVDVEHANDLLRAIVEAFERITSRALQQGLIQGYRTIEEALPVVRGRIRESDQLRRRFGLPVPIEVRYDDFTVDTAENRLLRAAVLVARRLPDLGMDLRHRLRRLELQLAAVMPITSAGLLELWHPTRLNARYHDALRLAEIIVQGSSFELAGDELKVTGLIIDMAKVFEGFVCSTLGERLRELGGITQTQDPWFLDRDGQVRMKPDLVWYRDDTQPTAVIDAKYKAEKPDGFPDADLYQILAYCTALRLPIGHLVYAKGNEAGRTHYVAGADVILCAHTLDLSQQPRVLLEEADRLATTIAAEARTASSVSVDDAAPGVLPRT